MKSPPEGSEVMLNSIILKKQTGAVSVYDNH
jgi:hypothetical protein